MEMREKLKIAIIIMGVIIFSINFLGIYQVSASSVDDIMQGADDFLKAGDSVSSKYTTMNMTALKSGSDMIYNVFLAVGTVIAVIIGLILGIQFIISAADEKAKIKEALIAYFIGCVVIFGAFTIWKVLVDIGNKF